MALALVPADDRTALERLVDEAIEGEPLLTCSLGVHVQEADEMWCCYCGEFIPTGTDVIAPAL